MAYGYFEHRHRFSVWAAARAAQRGFASVGVLREALETTDLRVCLENPAFYDLDGATFEDHHRRWCATIVSFLIGRGLTRTSYGRAAKLLAVYLKAMVVLGPAATSNLAFHAHPPIDSILLKNLGSSPAISPHQPRWHQITWTTLDEPDYYRLIADLRWIIGVNTPFWMLEQYWNVTD